MPSVNQIVFKPLESVITKKVLIHKSYCFCIELNRVYMNERHKKALHLRYGKSE